MHLQGTFDNNYAFVVRFPVCQELDTSNSCLNGAWNHHLGGYHFSVISVRAARGKIGVILNCRCFVNGYTRPFGLSCSSSGLDGWSAITAISVNQVWKLEVNRKSVSSWRLYCKFKQALAHDSLDICGGVPTTKMLLVALPPTRVFKLWFCCSCAAISMSRNRAWSNIETELEQYFFVIGWAV